MILIKESDPRNLFANRLGVLTFDIKNIILEFNSTINYKGRWRDGDSISREIISKNEISHLIKEFKIKGFPFEIYDESTMKDLIDFLRS